MFKFLEKKKSRYITPLSYNETCKLSDKFIILVYNRSDEREVAGFVIKNKYQLVLKELTFGRDTRHSRSLTLHSNNFKETSWGECCPVMMLVDGELQPLNGQVSIQDIMEAKETIKMAKKLNIRKSEQEEQWKAFKEEGRKGEEELAAYRTESKKLKEEILLLKKRKGNLGFKG